MASHWLFKSEPSAYPLDDLMPRHQGAAEVDDQIGEWYLSLHEHC